jgi:hypothetical protein
MSVIRRNDVMSITTINEELINDKARRRLMMAGMAETTVVLHYH